MIEKLNDGHVIKTMFTEHEHILTILDELQILGEQLSEQNHSKNEKLLPQINQLSIKLISAEPHHQREEKILFPAMEEKGVTDPTHVMRIEHEVMREMKHALKNETEKSKSDWPVQVEKVPQLISELCKILRQHIDKENNILYPMALQAITEESEWIELKIKCDEIGYCCFCPDEPQGVLNY
jgi:DUF438 domain-containing protein